MNGHRLKISVNFWIVVDVITVNWSDICKRHLTNELQGDEYDIALFVPVSFVNEESVKEKCDQYFGQYDWSRSFTRPQIIYYDERITADMLVAIHNWLRQRAGDITNIIIITTHVAGLADWWTQRCEIYHEKSFTIKEWPFIRTINWQSLFVDMVLQDQAVVKTAKTDMKFLFSYYGGWTQKHDNAYLTLKMMDLFPVSLIDFVAKFQLTKQQMIDYSMFLTYFCDMAEEQHIQELYQEFITQDNTIVMHDILTNPTYPRIRAEKFAGSEFQWDIDRRCFATVCRETDNTQPFGIVTEKTMRGFYHHMAVVPLGYKTVEYLEKYGFWFPQDIIDFSYQHEKGMLARMNKMIQSLKNFSEKYSMDQINEYYQLNFDKFRENAKLCVGYRFTDIDQISN